MQVGEDAFASNDSLTDGLYRGARCHRSGPPRSFRVPADVVARTRARLGVALDRAALLPRSRLVAVACAIAVVALPVGAGPKPIYRSLSVPEMAIVALIGLSVGWLLLDRMVALRIHLVMVLGAVAAIAVALVLASRFGHVSSVQRGIAMTLAVSVVFGGLARGIAANRRSVASLVVIGSLSSWLAYDIPRLQVAPLRDIRLYLNAGTTALHGASPYITAPIASVTDPEKLPFVYPPFTIPLFQFLAALPRPVVIGIWEAGSIAAVVAAFWLIGVRGRWLLVLLAWPATAVGIAVGNVASFTFLLYALGFRFGAALLLSGIFKFQSVIPGLWLVLQRRWREIAAGLAIIAAIALITLPIVGVGEWVAWPSALRFFSQSLQMFPKLQGAAVDRVFGPIVSLGITAVMIAFAALAHGRLSLARFGLASVVSSPTLYAHGLSPLLPGALFLGPELVWLFLGLGRFTVGFGVPGSWLAMALVGLALLVARGDDLRLPADLSPARTDVHPAGASGQVWPAARSAPTLPGA